MLLQKFKAAKKSLGNLDAETAGELIATAADIVLIVDKRGVIRDVAFGSEDLATDIPADLIGRSWPDMVTLESRLKVEALLRDAMSKSERRWRQVNHPAARGADVPILFSAVLVGNEGRIVAMGRDLRVLETLQQRLLNVEQFVDREISRLRHAETRYRLLLQITSDAILIVNSATGKITEANPAASQMLGASVRRLVGRSFAAGFNAQGSREIEALLAAARATGRAEEVLAKLTVTGLELGVSAALFRQDDASHFLVRLRTAGDLGAAARVVLTPAHSRLLEVLEASPDGLIVTSPDGEILTTNRAFLDLAQLATVEQARGQPLERWLGRQGADDVEVAAGDVVDALARDGGRVLAAVAHAG